MLSNPKDFTNRACIIGFYDDELKNMINEMPKDGIFVDFGANQGLYSLIADKHLTEGRVFGFEPARPTFEIFIANLRLNDAQRVVALNLGVANETSIASFRVPEGHSGAGQLEQAEKANQNVLLVNGGEIVRAMALEDPSYVLVKIDTEGSENIILSELKRTGFLDFVDCLYIELDEALLAQQSSTIQDAYDLLDVAGFAPQTDRRHRETHFDEIFKRKTPR